jgi:DNA mismatch repair protein MutL
MTSIRKLPPTLINQIAAGEVVERPASVLKELIENALDAGSTRIQVRLRDAGKSFLSVTDNGLGISEEDLPLALERHATSKLPEDHLLAIRTFGFRGEALPAIGSVSRLTLTSRMGDTSQGFSLSVSGGIATGIRPACTDFGTQVEVSDLFFATPARLKFLKSDRSEMLAIRVLIDQIALAHPKVSFEVREDGAAKAFVNYEAPAQDTPLNALHTNRLKEILGDSFAAEAIPLSAEGNGYRLHGFLGLPTASVSTSSKQFLYVCGRPVRDRLLSSLIKVAYQDTLPSGRFPAVVLFLDVPSDVLDVNVHPAKTEVRFSDTAFLKEFLLSHLKRALSQNLTRTSQTLTSNLFPFQASPKIREHPVFAQPSETPPPLPPLFPPVPPHRPSIASSHRPPAPPPGASLEPIHPLPTDGGQKAFQPQLDLEELPLGHALGQIHQSYIVAQNTDGFVIVDQHAAHERVVYEQMKAKIQEGDVPREALLIPQVISVTPAAKDVLMASVPMFQKLGLDYHFFGEGTLILREVPSLLKNEDWSVLMQDLADLLQDARQEGLAVTNPLEHALYQVVSSLSCQRKSVKAGRKLSLLEMNSLLRAMEATPNAAQCNHGRPTYVTLALSQIDTLFKRR